LFLLKCLNIASRRLSGEKAVAPTAPPVPGSGTDFSVAAPLVSPEQQMTAKKFASNVRYIIGDTQNQGLLLEYGQ
jgi:hypothetical protein